MRVNGELFRAQLENLTADPSAGVVGRVWMRSDLGDVKVSTASLIKKFLLNDQNIVIGTSGTAATNARLYRAGTGKLALVLGSDSTAEGSLAAPTSWAEFASVLPTDTSTNITALARKAGVMHYASDYGLPVIDDGTNLNPLGLVNRNYIINGNYDFWQRGTSFASAASGTFSTDRFYYVKSGTTAVHSLLRSTDVPTQSQSGYQSLYSYHIDCTTADGAVAAGDTVYVATIMEGYNFASIYNNYVTLSFWVKATKTGTYCVSFIGVGSNRSYISEYTVSTTDTWEKKVITLQLNTGGTETFDNGGGLQICWTLMCGSTNQGTAGAWAAGAKFATSNQVNACDSTSNDFKLSQVCLNLGKAPLPFVRAGQTVQGELALCQRYYEKSYAVDTDPASVTTTNMVSFHNVNSVNTRVTVFFKATKRIAPTITNYSRSDGSTGSWYDGTSGLNRSVTNVEVGTNSYCLNMTATNAYVANSGDIIDGHFVADAEI